MHYLQITSHRLQRLLQSIQDSYLGTQGCVAAAFMTRIMLVT
jgi:hypothetical protein